MLFPVPAFLHVCPHTLVNTYVSLHCDLAHRVVLDHAERTPGAWSRNSTAQYSSAPFGCTFDLALAVQHSTTLTVTVQYL